MKEKLLKELLKEFPSEDINNDFICYDMEMKDEKQRRDFYWFDKGFDEIYYNDIVYTLKQWKLQNPKDDFTLCIINTSDKDISAYYGAKAKHLHLSVSVWNKEENKYDCCVNTIYFIGISIPIIKNKTK